MSDESTRSPSPPNNILDPSSGCLSDKIWVKCIGSYLKRDKITYAHKTIANNYIFYEINKNYNISSYPTLATCFFVAVILSENNDTDVYKYSGYVIGFDRKWKLSKGIGFGRNCITFGTDMNFFVHVYNK